jgi:hypothetical protein
VYPESDFRCRYCHYDPQSSRGLLIAYSSDSMPQMLELLGSWNFDHARVEGGLCATQPRIRVS